jgi:hypothetical protein
MAFTSKGNSHYLKHYITGIKFKFLEKVIYNDHTNCKPPNGFTRI